MAAYDPLHQTPHGPIPLSIALMLAPADFTDHGAEVARPDYHRMLISFVTPSDAPPGTIIFANTATTEWPRARSLWGNIGWLTAYSPGGLYFGWGSIVSPVDEITPQIVRIDRGDVARFRASGMRITPGYQPPRPYSRGQYSDSYSYSRYSRNAQMLTLNGAVSGAFLPSEAPCSGLSQWVLEALP